MDEYGLREFLANVQAGRLSRRSFIQTMVASAARSGSLTLIVGRAILPATTKRPARAERRRRHLVTGEQGEST